MPELLPGKTPPKSIDKAYEEEVKRLDSQGPDPGLEEEDDGTEEIVYESETPEADAGGQAPPVSQRPADKSAAPTDQPTPPAPKPSASGAVQTPNDGGTQAPVSGAVADDPWAETEDVEYVDVDSGETYVVRAPKKYSGKIKGAYQARSATDRKLSSWGRNREWLDPLIANGSFDKLAPHLRTIFSDQELQRGMADLINRRSIGLPLQFIDQATAADRAVQEPQRQQQQAPAFFDEQKERAALVAQGYDEYTINAVLNSSKALAEQFGSRYSNLEKSVNDLRSETQRREEAQRQAQAAQQQMRQVGAMARQQLLSWYPNELTEQTPPEVWNQIEAYARNSGMLDAFGFTAGAFTTAYQRMREIGLVKIPGQTIAPSAAVDAVAAVEANARAQAAAAAQQVGRQTAPTNGAAPTNGTLPAPQKVKVPTHRKDLRTGKMIPLTPIEQANWMRDHTPKRQPAGQ